MKPERAKDAIAKAASKGARVPPLPAALKKEVVAKAIKLMAKRGKGTEGKDTEGKLLCTCRVKKHKAEKQ